MEKLKLFDAEYKLMDIIWNSEPINSTQLTKICLEKMAWKKSTVYTMIRKLTQRSLLKNEHSTVTTLVKREEVQKFESEELLEKSFNGSLPMFIATFLQGRTLSEKEAEDIKKMIGEATK